MQLDATRTVREFAIEVPGATRVFEKLRIDYCCGGNQPLDEACTKTGLDVDEVLQLVTQAGQTLNKTDNAFDVQTGSLGNLTNYIVNKHHTFTRDELERLTALFERVCTAHAPNHPELLDLFSKFRTLKTELEPHIMKEERILFPYIEQLEEALTQKRLAPFAPFGTVRNPIGMMMKEHDAAGDLLREMRKVSADYAVPEDACISYGTLYDALREFEADLHEHIHLENNILFPRAAAVENEFEQVRVV
jgi:regulator of cell morphogenesis and NO signaling